MTTFSRLRLNNWRQYSNIDLDLSAPITILTGQNGCGKTTLLNVLSRHFGWNTQFVSTPYISGKKAKKIWTDIYGPNREPSDSDHHSNDLSDTSDKEISYSFDEIQIQYEQYDWVDNIIKEEKTIGNIDYENGVVNQIKTHM